MDLDPGAICSLAECGELMEVQFLSVMERSSDDVVQAVFERIKDTALEGFLVRSDNFQPLLDLALAALSVNSMRSRAKTWLVNASKAQVKSDVIRCSQIIQHLASYTLSNHTSRRQPSGSISASQPIIAPVDPLGPNAQPTAPMQALPVHLTSAQGSQPPPPPERLGLVLCLRL